MLVAPLAELKFLGVTIDDRLKFDVHIHVVCKKVSSGTFVLRSLLKIGETDVRLTAVFTQKQT